MYWEWGVAILDEVAREGHTQKVTFESDWETGKGSAVQISGGRACGELQSFRSGMTASRTRLGAHLVIYFESRTDKSCWWIEGDI